VDVRDNEFRAAERWSDENAFSNRAYFIPEKHPAELGLDNIRKEDTGIYRCRVDFKNSQSRISKVNLTVIGKYCTFIYINFIESKWPRGLRHVLSSTARTL
jgi:hypothetical protein